MTKSHPTKVELLAEMVGREVLVPWPARHGAEESCTLLLEVVDVRWSFGTWQLQVRPKRGQGHGSFWTTAWRRVPAGARGS